jgi:hypothetical protein
MSTKSDQYGLSQDAFEGLLLQEHWLSTHTQFLADSNERKLQLLLAERTNPDDLIDVIRQFVALVDKGITPPAIILAAAAKGFREYIHAAGNKTLDVAFNLKSKQGVGHPLVHRAFREKRARIVYLMWSMRHAATLEGGLLSIEDAAGEVINKLGLDLDEDALKKSYIEMKADEIFGYAFEVMAETSGAGKQ